MRAHLDLLGWLFALIGAMGVLTGVSLILLAAGIALPAGAGTGFFEPLVWLFAVAAAAFVAGGGILWAIGRGIGHRYPRARPAALVAAAANLCLLPFGTALGVYAFWVLVNDEARREFGRRPRTPPAASVS
jgi:hypothetical protein